MTAIHNDIEQHRKVIADALALLIAVLILIAVAIARRGALRGWPLSQWIAGAIGAIAWATYLFVPGHFIDSYLYDRALVGVIGLAGWWAAGVIGLVLLVAAWPRGGSRAAASSRAATVGTVALYLLIFLCSVALTWVYVFAWV